MINKFINEIRRDWNGFCFIGDGCGDFEKRDKEASIECIKDYTKRLGEQFNLAMNYLETSKKKDLTNKLRNDIINVVKK